MGIKETVLGWLRSTPDKGEDLEDAALEETEREYAAEKADMKADSLLGQGDFDSDQSAPR